MYARGGSGGLTGTDPQVRRGNEDLTQEEQQAREERDHGGDEEQGHGHRFTPRESWLQRGPRLLERPGKGAHRVHVILTKGCWPRSTRAPTGGAAPEKLEASPSCR